jgi:hypothetical protein
MASAPKSEKQGGKRRAVTLIEAVLFIGVALALIVGGLVFYRQASTARLTQQTVALLANIRAEVMSAMRRPGWEDPTMGYYAERWLIQMGAIPELYIGEGTGSFGKRIRMPWSASSDPKGAGVHNMRIRTVGDCRYVSIQLEEIPREICTRLAIYSEDGTGIAGNGIMRVGLQYPGPQRWAPGSSLDCRPGWGVGPGSTAEEAIWTCERASEPTFTLFEIYYRLD